MYLLGYDIGSSSIKAALVNQESGEKVAVVQVPETELPIAAPFPNWAEQDPKLWWDCLCKATHLIIKKTKIDPKEVKAIGIAYQMHGLVMVDGAGTLIRPSIIWCDSRAVAIGEKAFETLGESFCLNHYLNSPGNFTASKLRWVRENEPEKYDRIYKVMLPGDYIAYKMSGEIQTTITGLSEGIFWDFSSQNLATDLLNSYEIEPTLIPDLVDNFSIQGKLTINAAIELGLQPGIAITYRAGDQPNNAMTLNVLQPGEVAATGGTSGVVYAVVDGVRADPLSRVNGFAHVNYTVEKPVIGILLCINGAGILYGWMRSHIAPPGATYGMLENEAAKIPVGSDGLIILPFGNGAERVLQNQNPGAQILGLQLNRHGRAHLYRASLEAVAFAFYYGIKILREMDLELNVLRVGNDNLFLSNIFSETIANLTGAEIEMIDATGAVGAALAAGVGVGAYSTVEEAQRNVKIEKKITPNLKTEAFTSAYYSWEESLTKTL